MYSPSRQSVLGGGEVVVGVMPKAYASTIRRCHNFLFGIYYWLYLLRNRLGLVSLDAVHHMKALGLLGYGINVPLAL